MIHTLLNAVAPVADSLTSSSGLAEPSVRENFVASLSILGKGMLGIFVFMLMFYLLIYGLERVFKPKQEQ